ncbi:MAG: DNA-processing protein DprA [Deltaproteobacteria bacterium]|jgi:DNA processing protein|nr:DNA-processing protein DprA [Deltaproteobacteria bacterium]
MQHILPPSLPLHAPQAQPSALFRLSAEQRREFWASLALRHAQGLGLRSCKRLLDYFGSAYEAARKPRDWPAAKVHADKAVRFAEASWRLHAQKEWEGACALDADILLRQDPRYPQRLKELPDAPLLLYCRGDMQFLHAPCVAVVGSRHCSQEGIAVAREIAGQLSAGGITVVSGLAMGIDSQAHLAALQHAGGTVAVLGTGLDVVYPKNNTQLFAHIASQGLLLTEFMPSAPPDASHFPIRNRLISGLSLGVLIVEATRRSGSLITARLALEQNREVYAVPGSVFAQCSAGCQDLVRQGARAVFSAEDILRDLAPQLRDYGGHAPQRAATQPAAKAVLPQDISLSKPETPDGDFGRIVRALRTKGPCHVDELARELELPVARLSALLVQLELQALVLRLPGMRYKVSA